MQPGSFLISLCIGLLSAAILFGALAIGSIVLLPVFAAYAISAIVLIYFKRRLSLETLLDARGWIVIFSAYLVSDFSLRQYSFWQGSFRLIEICGALLLTLILFKYLRSSFSFCVVALATLGAALSFITYCGSNLIFSDDHATFYYRLWLLKNNGFSLPFFFPMWNGGIDARDFFPTGAHGVFILFAPLIYLARLDWAYNIIVATLVFVLPGCCTGLAAWFNCRSFKSSCLAVTLGCASSLFWYRWGLSYGTLGFLCSISFIPLALSLASNLINQIVVGKAQADFRSITLFCSCFSFAIIWPLATITFIPAIVFATLNFGKLVQQRLIRFGFAALVVIHLPWMIVFARSSHVASYISAPVNPSPTAPIDPRLKSVADNKFAPISAMRVAFAPLNPLIGFFMIPALITAWCRRRRLEVISFAWLITLGAGVAHWYPQLELDRMFLVATLVVTPLIAAWLVDVIERMDRVFALFPLAACLLVPITSYRAANNHTPERFFIRAQYVEQIAEFVRKNANNGRALMTGFSLHELSYGHLAPLALMSGVPFIANSYVHDQWQRADVIPRKLKNSGIQGVEKYLELYNVSLLLAHDHAWQKWLNQYPEQFRLLETIGPFEIFSYKKFSNNYFEQGSGTIIEQGQNGVKLTLSTPSAVIKFKYNQFLISNQCQLEPIEVISGDNFIQLRNCQPDVEVQIRAQGFWRRLIN